MPERTSSGSGNGSGHDQRPSLSESPSQVDLHGKRTCIDQGMRKTSVTQAITPQPSRPKPPSQQPSISGLNDGPGPRRRSATSRTSSASDAAQSALEDLPELDPDIDAIQFPVNKYALAKITPARDGKTLLYRIQRCPLHINVDYDTIVAACKLPGEWKYAMVESCEELDTALPYGVQLGGYLRKLPSGWQVAFKARNKSQVNGRSSLRGV